jgi:hypothetical protein
LTGRCCHLTLNSQAAPENKKQQNTMPRAMVDTSRFREEDSPMAKRAKSKAKVSKTKKAKGDALGLAMKALESAGVPAQPLGKLSSAGLEIDSEQLEALKRKLSRGVWKRARFVALNAPFKRRSPIPPA